MRGRNGTESLRSTRRGWDLWWEKLLGSCRLFVKIYFLSIIVFPPRYAQGKVLALAASAIGLGIAMAGTFGVRCRAWLSAQWQWEAASVDCHIPGTAERSGYSYPGVCVPRTQTHTQ
jgi:hypothetical protein